MENKCIEPIAQIITTNKRFYVIGQIKDIIAKIQDKKIDKQTGKKSIWCYFDTINTFNDGEQAYDMLIYVKSNKVAIKKSAIKSIIQRENGIVEDNDENAAKLTEIYYREMGFNF